MCLFYEKISNLWDSFVVHKFHGLSLTPSQHIAYVLCPLRFEDHPPLKQFAVAQQLLKTAAFESVKKY